MSYAPILRNLVFYFFLNYKRLNELPNYTISKSSNKKWKASKNFVRVKSLPSNLYFFIALSLTRSSLKIFLVLLSFAIWSKSKTKSELAIISYLYFTCPKDKSTLKRKISYFLSFNQYQDN